MWAHTRNVQRIPPCTGLPINTPTNNASLLSQCLHDKQTTTNHTHWIYRYLVVPHTLVTKSLLVFNQINRLFYEPHLTPWHISGFYFFESSWFGLQIMSFHYGMDLRKSMLNYNTFPLLTLVASAVVGIEATTSLMQHTSMIFRAAAVQ